MRCHQGAGALKWLDHFREYVIALQAGQWQVWSDKLPRSPWARLKVQLAPLALAGHVQLRWSHGQNIHPSKFPDQNLRVNSHHRQPRAQLLKPVQVAAAPSSSTQPRQPQRPSRPTHHRPLSTRLPSSPTRTARPAVNWVLNRKMHGPGHLKCWDTQTVAICNCC